MPNKKKRTKKVMEFPDAPSGYVTLYNMKEPYMPYEGGYGYMGVLLFDGKTDRVQCHLCGNWEQNLPAHLWYGHATRATVYKKMVGLGKRTALISDTIREKLIAHGQEARLSNLRPGGKKSASEREKVAAGLRAYYKTREMQNVHGTCPLQLLTALQKQADELGRTPRHDEIKKYDSYIKVFGSVSNAIKRAGLSFRKPGVNVMWRARAGGQNIGEGRYSKELVLDLLRDFIKENGRNPATSDCRRGLLPSTATLVKFFGSFKKAVRAAQRV